MGQQRDNKGTATGQQRDNKGTTKGQQRDNNGTAMGQQGAANRSMLNDYSEAQRSGVYMLITLCLGFIKILSNKCLSPAPAVSGPLKGYDQHSVHDSG